MHSTQKIMRLGALMVCAAGIANAAYTIQDTYDDTNFFDEFTFFSASDPTNGFVDFVSSTVANDTALAGFSNNQVYLGVDHTTVNPTGGRASTRLSSNKAYTHGLFIADIAHMPGSICGVWPAFWTFGPNWPSSGEIDIIEGVNTQSTDQVTLHTSGQCSMSNSGSASGSDLTEANCNAGNGNDGCPQTTTAANNYGTDFNSIGGGVYALDWTSDYIAIYFFPRTGIPSDITSGSPDPSGWGTPMTKFVGNSCDIDDHFMNHNIIFDTTFCGDWAGQVWAQGTCASLASTCDAYVGANPSAFTEAFWMINSVKVYSDSGSAGNVVEGGAKAKVSSIAAAATSVLPTTLATVAATTLIAVTVPAASSTPVAAAPIATSPPAASPTTTPTETAAPIPETAAYSAAAPGSTLEVLPDTFQI